MNRRVLVRLIGAAAVCPLAARAQQSDRARRIGVLMGVAVAGSAAAWPLATHAQQPTTPVVGYLQSASPSYYAQFTAAVADGLKQAGYVEGQNVAIEYRSAEGHYDRLTGLVADLIRRPVDVILAAGGSDPAKAAKAATSTIPIVFVSAADPVRTGLVASLNRPGGNVTGVSLLASALDAKKLGLLRELAPKVSTVGVLINPNYPSAKSQADEAQAAAGNLGLKPIMLSASTDGESMRHSRAWPNKAAARCSWPPTRSCSAGAKSSWRLPRAMPCQRSTRNAKS
jgi:ABC-type uncharacterized transport system substrate-binding protein